MSGAYSEFFSEGTLILYIFFIVFFLIDLILSNFGYKNDSKGVRRHAPSEKFENCTLQWPFLNNF